MFDAVDIGDNLTNFKNSELQTQIKSVLYNTDQYKQSDLIHIYSIG